jgi:hypothetical protein
MRADKLVAYYRVSTARQEASGLGLDAQRQAVAAFQGRCFFDGAGRAPCAGGGRASCPPITGTPVAGRGPPSMPSTYLLQWLRRPSSQLFPLVDDGMSSAVNQSVHILSLLPQDNTISTHAIDEEVARRASEGTEPQRLVEWISREASHATGNMLSAPLREQA